MPENEKPSSISFGSIRRTLFLPAHLFCHLAALLKDPLRYSERLSLSQIISPGFRRWKPALVASMGL